MERDIYWNLDHFTLTMKSFTSPDLENLLIVDGMELCCNRGCLPRLLGVPT